MLLSAIRDVSANSGHVTTRALPDVNLNDEFTYEFMAEFVNLKLILNLLFKIQF